MFIICEKLIKMSGKTSILKSRDCECDDELDEYNFTRHYLSNRPNDALQKFSDESSLDSETDYNSTQKSKDNEADSIDTFDPDYNLHYEIDNFPEKEENLEIEDKLLLDSLAELETDQMTPDEEYLKPEIMSKHRPSFEVLQKSLLNYNERIAPPEVILTVLTSEPKNDDVNFNSMIYNYQVIRLVFIVSFVSN